MAKLIKTMDWSRTPLGPIDSWSQSLRTGTRLDGASVPHLRILIVDDDPALRKSLRDALESDGHATVTANGGQEGIDVFIAARAGATHSR